MSKMKTRTLKTDFHLHTHHSDNRDRMTPADYVQLAQRHGYDVLGFCDHHHNLTQASWRDLQAEVRGEMAALQGAPPLLTTGYEATWMSGHLCVLGKEQFDGESIVACDRQMWSPANTRILAHPDNNICAWHLPLPVDVQGVEVINGGQDPYSVYMGSPCNGLATFQRYLLLNHRVAAIAQSDCHQRVVFGRAWTGVQVDEDAPLQWEVVQASLHAAHTYATMGDLPLRVWLENGCAPGDVLQEGGVNTLQWEAPGGAEVTIYVADRAVAHFDLPPRPGQATSSGHYRLRHNGPHWLLVKQGLAWAVSSPVWVSNQPVDSAPIRRDLAQHGPVQAQADALRRRTEWLAALEVAPQQTPYPVARYVAWLNSQLPHAWTDADPAFSGPGDGVDWAMARLHAAQEIALPILRDLQRVHYRERGQAGKGARILVASHAAPLPAGVYRATVELPLAHAAPALATEDGRVVPSLAATMAGERDPLHGPRSRVQMNELVTWLERGEIHEYQMHNCQLTCENSALRLLVDLWPAALGGAPVAHTQAAQTLAAAIADPSVQSFFVHLRMPKRYALIFALDEVAGEFAELEQGAEGKSLVLEVIAAPTETEAETEKRTLRFFADDALAVDPSAHTAVVQLG